MKANKLNNKVVSSVAAQTDLAASFDLTSGVNKTASSQVDKTVLALSSEQTSVVNQSASCQDNSCGTSEPFGGQVNVNTVSSALVCNHVICELI